MIESIKHAHIGWVAVCDAVQPACGQKHAIVSAVKLRLLSKQTFTEWPEWGLLSAGMAAAQGHCTEDA